MGVEAYTVSSVEVKEFYSHVDEDLLSERRFLINFFREVRIVVAIPTCHLCGVLSKNKTKQVAFQSNANHPLAESMGYIKFEGM